MTDGQPSRYEVVFDSRAGKELGKLDKPVARRVYSAVMTLAEENGQAGRGCAEAQGGTGTHAYRHL